MKSKVLRFLSAVLAFCLFVCAFAACGSDKKETTAETSSVMSKTSRGTESNDSYVVYSRPSVEDPPYNSYLWDPYASISDSIKVSTVRFATWIDHTKTEGVYALANFYEVTGLKAEIFTVAQNGYINKLKSSIASGDIPDVFVSDEKSSGFPLTLQTAAPIDVVSHVELKDPVFDQTLLETGRSAAVIISLTPSALRGPAVIFATSTRRCSKRTA